MQGLLSSELENNYVAKNVELYLPAFFASKCAVLNSDAIKNKNSSKIPLI